ncbi:YusW family protein [Sporosarcina cyprini]|uniref:YusW family protein n=1 Tax=Sporosarcina cyprini TaxID=2910523 RepID=UPI001EDCC4D0|nr:YusW family protein [Sporosarcina cyprini]MCG3087996.1 YusW family protein [Sporosarcina cyprini]
MKKATSISGILLAAALVLGACGTTNDKTTGTSGTTEPNNSDMNNTTTTDKVTDNAETHTNAPATNGTANAPQVDHSVMNDKWGKLDYMEFDLSVDYGQTKESSKEVEIEVEEESGMLDAKWKDERNNQIFKGQEAFDQIYPKIEKLKITKDTKKEEAIKQVLKEFDLPNDYKKFDLEIKFRDNTKIEFEDRK